MPKRVLLEARPGPPQFNLFGISCHLRDFRLSFLLNREMELEFVKMDDFQGFSFYFYRDEDKFTSYYMLGNRGEESFLVPDLKQTDFLLLAEGPMKKTQKEKLLTKIRGIQNVLTAFEIRFETIRRFDMLLPDLEIHLMNILKESKSTFLPMKK
ncbi:MAG TPA: IPExxxVDY family protein [Bacteroidales bacterium]|nr:IPExxxVDY family protein [Bacteroidales bacterium]HPS62490.1 IPExxxVDY family protein [Bacteroidales bacterium]